MPEVVIDASIAAKWQLPDEDYLPEAEFLRQEIETGSLILLVPALWSLELASVMSKAAANGRISTADAEAALTDLIELPYRVVAWPEPVEAFRLARRYNRSLFDSMYLAVAEQYGCDFWTDDRKLTRAVAVKHPFVRWIGDDPRREGST